jgi:hypothetical protein
MSSKIDCLCSPLDDLVHVTLAVLKDTSANLPPAGPDFSTIGEPVGTRPLLTPQNHKLIWRLWKSSGDWFVDVNFREQNSGTQSTIREYKKSITTSRTFIDSFNNARDGSDEEFNLSQIVIPLLKAPTNCRSSPLRLSNPFRRGLTSFPATLIPRHGLASIGQQLGPLNISQPQAVNRGS